jgi:hypothetical protein
MGATPWEARPPRSPLTRLDARTIVIISTTVRWMPRGGAAAARWAHNPKVGGSNPSPATSSDAMAFSRRVLLVFVPSRCSEERHLGWRFGDSRGLEVGARCDWWEGSKKRTFRGEEIPETCCSVMEALEQVSDVLVTRVLLA